MLKYLYKLFLVTLLCSSLLMIEITYQQNYFGLRLNAAKAESVQTGGAKEEGIGAIASTLEMTAIGLVAARLFKYGKITADMGVAAAGGLAFIAGEISAYSSLKKAKEEIETEIKRSQKTGDLTDEQRQSLIRLIQMYRNSKDAAETKKDLQLAAAAAFAAAGVIAYFFTTAELANETKCRVALVGGATSVLNTIQLSTCTPLVAGTYTAEEGARCNLEVSECRAAIAESYTLYEKYLNTRPAPAPSATKATVVTTEGSTFQTSLGAAAGACGTEYAGAAIAEINLCMNVVPQNIAIYDSTGSVPIKCENDSFPRTIKKLYAQKQLNNIKNEKRKSYEMLKNFFNRYIMSSASADLFSPMGIASSAAITLIMAFSETVATMVDTYILVPQSRAIIWAFMAAGAYAASTATEGAITKIDGDIKKLEDLVNTINKNNSGSITTNALASKNTKIKTLDNSGLVVSAVSNEDIKVTDDALPCVSGKSSTGKCNSFTQTLNSLPGVSSLPAGVMSDISQISKMAEGLNGSNTISRSTLSEASKVSGNANALMQKLRDAKSQTQTKLLASGSKLDLDKSEKEFSKKINDAFSQAVLKSKVNMKDVFASLGSNMTPNLSISGGTTKAIDNKKSSGLSGFVMPKIDLVAPAAPKMVELKEEKKAEPVAEVKAANATSIDEYDMKNDINTDKSTSIFEVISRRYEKSGYPRLFKRLNE